MFDFILGNDKELPSMKSKTDKVLGRQFWWIQTTDPDTAKIRVVGPYLSEYVAQIDADKKGVPAEVVSLPTKSPSKALSWVVEMKKMEAKK